MLLVLFEFQIEGLVDVRHNAIFREVLYDVTQRSLVIKTAIHKSERKTNTLFLFSNAVGYEYVKLKYVSV